MTHFRVLSREEPSPGSLDWPQGDSTPRIDAKWCLCPEKLDVFMFRKGGSKFLVDVERSIVLQISDLAWDIFRECRGQTAEEVVRKLKHRYARSSVAEALQELGRVQAAGFLTPKEARFLYRLPDSYIQSLPVEHLFLHITDSCNLRCAYCYNEAEFNRLGHMSPVVAKAAIDFLFESSGSRTRCIVEFFGGEPLLNIGTIENAVEYAEEKARKLGKEISFVLTTNGTLLTDRVMDFLDKHRVLTMVSLDGPREIHDACRRFPDGTGSFDIVFPKIQRLLRLHGERLIAVATLTHFSAKECGCIASFLRSAGFRTVYMSPVNVHFSSNRGVSGLDYALTGEDLRWIRRGYEDILRSPLGELPNIDFQGVGATMGLIHREEKRYYGCSRHAGISMLAVDPRGDVYPCFNLFGYEAYRMGNVLTSVNKVEVRREFIENSVDSTFCRRCWARYLCGGRCSVEGIVLGGGPKKAPEKCRIARSAIKELIALYAQLREEDPERLEELCRLGLEM